MVRAREHRLWWVGAAVLLCAALLAAALAPAASRAAAAGGASGRVTAVGAPDRSTPRAMWARARGNRTPRLRREQITVDGVRRSYLESVPSRLTRPVPLVIAFHGLFQTASSFAVQSGLVAATAAAREVLVLPESLGPAFNDGRLGRRGPRDDAFAVAVIDSFDRSGLVDPERVTVAGFSNGAGMAMQVADAHPDRVAAVVAIDGEMIRASYAPRPTGPVEAVLVHGTADRVQPWTGRRGWGPDFPAYVSVMDTVRAWVRADGCGAQKVTSPGGATVGGVRTDRVTAYRWAPGRSGAGVTFYRITGMGHRWPVTTLAADHGGDQLSGVGAAAIIARTALTASREGRRTVVS